jgi:hypothetical protein
MWAGALVVGLGLSPMIYTIIKNSGEIQGSPLNFFFYFIFIGGVVGLIQWWAMRGRLTAFWWWIPFTVVIVGWLGYGISFWHESEKVVMGYIAALLYVLLNLASGPAMLLLRKKKS